MKFSFHNTLIGVSVLPALFIMPAMADTINQRQVITTNTTYTDLVAQNIASTTANNGGVFYMQDVPNVVLTLEGASTFSGNSLNNGGMGGVIGNGWLSSTTGTGYTQGGKIVFAGATTFTDNSTNNVNGGGAIFNYGMGNATSPDIIFYDSANFTGNSVSASSNSVHAGGGAINHRNGMIVFNDSASFSGNESASQGGAIITAGDIIFNGTADFSDNTAGKSGGALAIKGGNTLFEGAASFTGNSAAGASAIYIGESAATLTFRDSATFTDNTGVGTLLNNNSGANVAFDRGATFDKNTNTYNGALVNAGSVSVSGGDLIFTDNTGSNGGGLKNAGTVLVDTTGDILFQGNTTTNSAGAFDNGGKATFAASNVSFVQNSADAGYGGAIFNAGDITIHGTNNIFSGNTASDSGATKSGGGAIHNRGNTGTAELIVGTDTSINTFASNTSNAYGGAIVSRAFDGTGQDSLVTINGTTTFENNQSALDGGAIWNMASPDNGTTGSATIVFNGDTVFRGNKSGGMGGALYNNDTVTFNGATTFAGNTANGTANDIHNDGTVNFNGDATLNGGITGTGTLNIVSGTTMNIGTSSITQGAIALNGTLMATLRSGDTAQLVVNNDGGFTGDGTIKLSFDQAGTYHVFGNQTFSSIDISNPVYDLTWNGGDVTATAKSAADIASENGLTSDTARVISGVSESSSARLNNLSVVFQEKLSSGTASDTLSVEQAATALNPDTHSIIQSAGVTLHNTVASLVSSRMDMAGLGRSGGDMAVDFGGIWAQGLYNKTKLNDTFNGYTRGVSVGIDGNVNDIFTMGLGYLYSQSDIRSNSRDTDIDSSSIFIYGQYQPTAWYANAVISYTMSDYTEDGTVFGTAVSSDYDADIFGARIASGYDFIGGITPEIAMQYLHINSVDYTNSLGIRNHFDGSDYLTASLGTKYAFDYVLNNGWIVRPQMHYALKYDLISDENSIMVTMPGVNPYRLSGERLSRIANEVGIGLGMNYMGFEMSITYDLESRNDYTSQTGRLNFRYEF